MAGKIEVARRERLHRVCKNIIDNPRSVDDDTVAQFKSAALKYVATQYADTAQGFKDLYKVDGELGDLVRGAFDVVVSKRLDNMEISPLTGAAYNRTRQLLDDEDDDGDEEDDLMTDDINKAHRDRGAGGHRSLTGALLEHLHDRLERRREQHGYQKSAKDDPPMDTLYSIMKAGSIAGVCAQIVAKGTTTLTRLQIVEAVSKIAAAERYPELSEAQAFAKILDAPTEEARLLQQALKVAEAAEFAVFDIEPIVVGGPDAMHAANDDDDSAVLRATEEIQRIGREKFPFLSADQQFARVFEDSKYAALAAQAHRRPTAPAGGVYAFPTAVAKSDHDFGVPKDSAYSELMAKAAELRKTRPELSVAQCFEKIYTNRANVELAKRERIESAVR